MRVLLAISLILSGISAQKIAINVPCNKELDGLLTADPNGDERAFMSCQGVGVGTIGFWERKMCPNNMTFDFINQQCKGKKARKQQKMNIAILNNSCANGETCIGGSVCDLDSLRCMCPYGTTPKLDTLSCETSQQPFVSATVDGASQLFNSYSGLSENRQNNRKGFNEYSRTDEIPEFQPNNNAFMLKNNNNNQNGDYNWNRNFQWKGSLSNINSQLPASYSINSNAPTDFPNSFQPNPNQKFVFNFNKNYMGNSNTAQTEKNPKITTLAIPGASCKSNEICIGGSICTLPIGICLCPGDLEARDGECVLPAASTISVSNVGIGALCSDLAECDHGSTCVMGRCTCVSPLVQFDGKCVLRQQQKIVGPGELCDNGEICSKGSVCDVMIPVCVCPAHTDLNNGECIQVTAPVTASVLTLPPNLPSIHTTPLPPLPQTQSPTQPSTQSTSVKQTADLNLYRTTHAPVPVFITPSTTPQMPKKSSNSFPQVKQSVKINQMKLGGSKQAGVGVRCSLNTDCMIGAYCNGNTNPPSCQCLSTHVNIEGRCEKVIYPGQVGCRSDLQCNAAQPGTHCIDRICVCPDGQNAVDQTCVSEKQFANQSCGPTNNMCIGKSVCFKKICICPDGFSFNTSAQLCEVNNFEHTECTMECKFPRACINHACICPDYSNCTISSIIDTKKLRYKRDTCVPESDFCSKKNACLEGYHKENGKCVENSKSVNIGVFCSHNDHCFEKCQCVSGRCNCPKACIDTMSCPVNWICKSGKCVCESNEFDINGNCLPTFSSGAFKNINNQCISRDRCAGGSKCKDNLCQCVEGAIEHSGKCKQLPGGYCSNGEICSGGSSCYLGVCRCDASRTLDNQRCVQMNVPIGSTCRKGQKCTNGSACRFGICMCISQTIPILGRCVPEHEYVPTSLKSDHKIDRADEKQLGMLCAPKDKCMNGSQCLKGICECDYDMNVEFGKCVKNCTQCETTSTKTTNLKNKSLDRGISSFSSRPHKFPPGSLCKYSSECSFRSKCIDGVCRCKKGETIVKLTCRSAIHHVLPGSVCDPINGYDCVGEATCQYGVCKCGSNLISNGEQCVPASIMIHVPPGKSCAKSEQCGGGSFCSKERICRCGVDEVLDINNKCIKTSKAIPVFNKLKPKLPVWTTLSISTTQSSNAVTSIDYTNFESKLNELERLEMEFKSFGNPEATITAPKLSVTSLAGHRCQNNSECPPFAFCFANACNCMAGFRASAGFCESAIEIGKSCISSNQCIKSAECVFGICTCIGSECQKDIRMIHPGDDCTSTKTICSFNSYCSLMSGVCECPSGMATKDNKCENTFESIGNDCVTSRNCQKYSYCDNGFCICKSGNNIDNEMCISERTGEKLNVFPFYKNRGMNTPLQNKIKIDFKEVINDGIFETTTKWPQLLTFTIQPPSALIPNNQPQNFQVYSSFPIAYGAKTVAEEENSSSAKLKMAFPGEFCGNGEICLGNSNCKNHFCRCLQDVTAENGVCPSQIDDLKILGLHYLLDDVRLQSSTKSAINNQLWRDIAYPLENCQNNEMCYGNSSCLNIGGLGKICQCNNNTALLNGECSDNESLDFIPVNDACNDESICVSGSECINEVCTCAEDKQLIMGICVKTASIYELCDNGEICVNGTICDESRVCSCPENTHHFNGNCVLKENLYGFFYNFDPFKSKGPRKIFRRELEYAGKVECISDNECILNYRCINSLCVCDNNESQCIIPKLVPPGSYCDNKGLKCSNDAICYMNACVCSYEDIPIDDHCVARDWHLGIGSACSNQQRCRPDLQCIAGLCMCKFGDVRCDPSEPVTSPPGGSCSNIRECTGGSVCREGWCICPYPSMIVNQGICIQSIPRPTILPKASTQEQQTISSHVSQITKPQSFVTEVPHGKKIIPGGKCGPLDICVGGSECVEGYCLCPAGQKPSSNGRCETVPTASPPSTLPASTAKLYSKPGDSCNNEQTCVGGSKCSLTKICECPEERSEISNGQCIPPRKIVEVVPGVSCNENTVCTKGSSCENGLCRCQQGYIAVSGICVALPMSTTPKMKISANPLENCENGEICVGGSSCDADTGICMCPLGLIVFNQQCITPPTQPKLTTTSFKLELTTSRPIIETDCEQDANCGDNKICVSGKCKCRPGFVDNSGKCESLEDLDAIERPIPVSYAKHKVSTLSERMLPKEEIELSNIERVTAKYSPSRQDTQKPRIVGPPIRRPRPKNKGGSSSSNGGGGKDGTRNYKTGSGNGNCPPGNDPTKDDSGKLIMCNGLEPNCPPRSYCYITSGGFATEEYNCCKSW